MKIIIINGSGGSGKSTFVAAAREHNPNVFEFSMVDIIKKIALNVGWDGVKDNKGRRLLSDLKDALDRYCDKTFQYVMEDIKWIYKNNPDAIIFVHVREPNDISRWVRETNARTLLIRRPGIEQYSNHADCNVFYYDYDYEYENRKELEQFKQDAIDFVDWIEEKNWQSHIKEG